MSSWIPWSWRIGNFRLLFSYMNPHLCSNCLKINLFLFSFLYFLLFLSLSFFGNQGEFQNVIDSVSTFGRASCFSASISWNPQRGESRESSFVLGFNSDTPQLNSSKVGKLCISWELNSILLMPIMMGIYVSSILRMAFSIKHEHKFMWTIICWMSILSFVIDNFS